MLFTRARHSLGGYPFTAFLRPSLMFFALFLALGGDRVLAQTVRIPAGQLMAVNRLMYIIWCLVSIIQTNVTCPSNYDWVRTVSICLLLPLV